MVQNAPPRSDWLDRTTSRKELRRQGLIKHAKHRDSKGGLYQRYWWLLARQPLENNDGPLQKEPPWLQQFPDDARVRTPYLDFFPSAFRNSSPDSVIYLSTLSVACSAVGSLCGLTREKRLGDMYFYKAISAVRRALENEATRENDETLMGILLLRIYDVLQAVKQSKQVVSIHSRGAAALVRLRSQKRAMNRLSVDLTNSARLELMAMSVWNGERAADVVNEESLLPSDYHPLTRLVFLGARALALQNRFNRLRLSTTKSDIFLQLLQQAIAVDSDIQSWLISLSDICFPGKASSSPNSGEPIFLGEGPDALTKKESFIHILNRYRTSRLMAQYVISGCVSQLDQPELHVQLERSRAIIQDLADGICSTLQLYQLDNYETSLHSAVSLHSPDRVLQFRLRMVTRTWTLLPYLTFIATQGFILREGQVEWIQNKIAQIHSFYQECESTPITRGTA
ncbi:predicted protein [Histoplasma mississippiense (nom. inval.)]|uniref:predicted protein n=1 Tax=Ajellomyces capsulatus (strain NAm1 / WU24) TaxID=2059318 RepID=UPI000157B783|nr:predicted protein [Histoplasma mississippiense (nom. inval.)]EDN04111.1 predicted protein [Histoplasma mississippiense (nom. inval.)]